MRGRLEQQSDGISARVNWTQVGWLLLLESRIANAGSRGYHGAWLVTSIHCIVQVRQDCSVTVLQSQYLILRSIRKPQPADLLRKKLAEHLVDDDGQRPIGTDVHQPSMILQTSSQVSIAYRILKISVSLSVFASAKCLNRGYLADGATLARLRCCSVTPHLT